LEGDGEPSSSLEAYSAPRRAIVLTQYEYASEDRHDRVVREQNVK